MQTPYKERNSHRRWTRRWTVHSNQARREQLVILSATQIVPLFTVTIIHYIICLHVEVPQSKQWLDTALATLINRSATTSCINTNSNDEFPLYSILLKVPCSSSRATRFLVKTKRFVFSIRRIKRNFIRPTDWWLFRYADRILGSRR